MATWLSWADIAVRHCPIYPPLNDAKARTRPPPLLGDLGARFQFSLAKPIEVDLVLQNRRILATEANHFAHVCHIARGLQSQVRKARRSPRPVQVRPYVSIAAGDAIFPSSGGGNVFQDLAYSGVLHPSEMRKVRNFRGLRHLCSLAF
jgi:hypothetical protein